MTTATFGRQLRIISVLTGLLLAPPASASELDRPFGIQMGQAVATLQPVIEFQLKRRSGTSDAGTRQAAAQQLGLDREITISSVPKPHPLLSRYSVTATDAAGVCSISGFAPLAPTDVMDKTLGIIERQLSEILGPPTILPGNQSPEVTRIWLWIQTGAPGERSSVERVSLSRFDDAGKRGAMLRFEFTNHLRCGSQLGENPFR